MRFVDDILTFAKSYEEIGHVLDVLVDALRQVGLVLNAGKTNILTTQSQHPAELVSPGGIIVEILERDRAHKWLGCMISTHTDGSHGPDLEHYLPSCIQGCFFFFLIRLVYGDTWAGKANGVINLAAQNKKRELSSAT